MTPEAWEAFALATVGLASPGTILITLMLLATDGGGRKAGAMWAGYATGLTVVGLIALSLGAGDTPQSDRTGEVQPAFVILGSLLIFFAVRTWRSNKEDAGPIRFLKKLDGVRASKMAAFGLAGSLINVKNLALFIAALTPLMNLDGNTLSKAPIVVGCVLVFTSASAGPIVLFMVGRSRVQPVLLRARQALERNKRRVTLVLLPLFGVLFLWRGLSPLLG